jgi:hypothetical protein
MNYRLTFLDSVSSAPVPLPHLLDRSGRLLGYGNLDGQFVGDLPTGELIISHVEYGRQPVTVQPGANVVRLTRATYNLPGFEVTAERKRGLPWWLWLLLIGAGGRAAKLW